MTDKTWPADGVLHREVFRDSSGDTVVTEWLCEPPAAGVVYQVIEQEWSSDMTVRTIRQIRIQEAG